MAIKKIEEVYLYVSEAVTNSAENIEAVAYMDHSGVPYTKLLYNDQGQHESVFSALNSWWTQHPYKPQPAVDTFPLLVYTEVHDDIPARYSPILYLAGIDAIKTFKATYDSVNQGA